MELVIARGHLEVTVIQRELGNEGRACLINQKWTAFGELHSIKSAPWYLEIRLFELVAARSGVGSSLG